MVRVSPYPPASRASGRVARRGRGHNPASTAGVPRRRQGPCRAHRLTSPGRSAIMLRREGIGAGGTASPQDRRPSRRDRRHPGLGPRREHGRRCGVQAVSWRRVVFAACLLAPACPAHAAGILGDTVEATCSAATKGDIASSTVTIVCGIPTEQAVEMMRLAASPVAGDRAELLRRLDAMIPAESRLRAEALAALLRDPRPDRCCPRAPDRQARRDREPLPGAARAGLGDPRRRPEGGPAQGRAKEALERGDLDRADALLKEVEQAQTAAADRPALELAATKAQRAGIALTRLRTGTPPACSRSGRAGAAGPRGGAARLLTMETRSPGTSYPGYSISRRTRSTGRATSSGTTRRSSRRSGSTTGSPTSAPASGSRSTGP